VAAGSHTYYVTAYGSAGESTPSSSVTVSCTKSKKHRVSSTRLSVSWL
jgi:hypothetical protein